MIIRREPCPLWRLAGPELLADVDERIVRALARGVERAGAGAELYFRADDVAVPSAAFAAMLDAFLHHRTPLAMAVTPAWLTKARAAELRRAAAPGGGLFSYHQHGWRHVNGEPAGQKKCEFGPARPARDKRADLERGRDKLAALLGDTAPLFTPPWNRCDGESLAILRDLGFTAVSRTPGARPDPPAGMVDIPVHADLHTRKAPDPDASLAGLLQELENGLASGRCGVMLHHQLANPASERFLHALLAAAARRSGLRTVPMARTR